MIRYNPHNPQAHYKFRTEELFIYMLQKFATGQSCKGLADNEFGSYSGQWRRGYNYLVKILYDGYDDVVGPRGLIKTNFEQQTMPATSHTDGCQMYIKQGAFYKRYHRGMEACIKVLTICLPNGLTAALYGPTSGREDDRWFFSLSSEQHG